MSNRAIIAPASVDPVDFYYAVTGRKRLTDAEKAERYERDQAWAECERKLLAGPRYDRERDDKAYAEYAERLRQIAAKYAEPLTEPVQGDPLLKSRRAA